MNHPQKLLLIQPPAEGCIRSLLPQLSGDNEWVGFKPPIGLLSIATTVSEQVKHCEVKIIDAQAQHFNVEQTIRAAVFEAPDIVGISAWTDFWWAAYQVGKGIKESKPTVHLCYGGPHINIFPGETLNLEFVDSIICGDGELPMCNLCNALLSGSDYNNIPGVYSKNKTCTQFIHYVTEELDALPIPDRRFLNPEWYNSVLGKNDKVTTMVTSRGCPNRCIYCKLDFQKPKSRTADNVIEEFRRIANLGIKEVELYDDTFTWSKQRVVDICNALIKEDIKLSWAVRDRVDRTDRELLHLMAKAGCQRIHFGIESGVEHILRIMRKGISLQQARNALKWSKGAKLETLTYFMLGGLDETREDMLASIKFAVELDADYAAFSITIPYPGTSLYNMALDRKIIPVDFWKHFAVNPEKDFVIPFFIEQYLSLAELIALHKKAVRTFYMRPKYILRQLTSVRSPSEFLRKARMGLQVLGKSITVSMV
jgi:radical SAM superfamily enzyme YgiQ (UPF0313 family)